MNQYQDVTEIVDVDADVDVIQVLLSVEITAAYGSFYFSSSVEDVAATHSVVTDAAATTAAYGSFYFSSSAEGAAVTHLAVMDAVITIADATIAAANKTNFKDGFFRPFFIF